MAVVSATLGHHYVVSAGHELAALAAFEVLEGGGNAIDAGVAAMLTLGVVYSDQVSVAGVAPMMIRLGATGEIVTIAGVGGWPRALNVDDYIARHGGEIPLGVRRTVIPAAPDAFVLALSRYGTFTFRDVAARAIRCASQGFPRHQVMLDYIAQHADDYRHWPENVDIWMPDGQVPDLGSHFVQSNLGATLQFLCDQELAAGADRLAGLAAVRHAFYQGDLAQQIVTHQRQHDGLLSAEDLANFSLEHAAAGEMGKIAPRIGAAPEHHGIDPPGRDPSDGETFGDRFDRHPPAVDLPPGQPFELHRGNQTILVMEHRDRVMIARMNPKNHHGRRPMG